MNLTPQAARGNSTPAATSDSQPAHPGNSRDLADFSTGLRTGTNLDQQISEAFSRDSLEDGLQLFKEGKLDSAKAMLATAQKEAKDVLVLLPDNRQAAERLEQSAFFLAYADYKLLTPASSAEDLSQVSNAMLGFLAAHPGSGYADNASSYCAETLVRSVGPEQILKASSEALNQLKDAPKELQAQFSEHIGDALKNKAFELSNNKTTASAAIAYYDTAADLPGYTQAPRALYDAAHTAYQHLSPEQAMLHAEKLLSRFPDSPLSDDARLILAHSHTAIAEQYRSDSANPDEAKPLEQRKLAISHFEKALESAPRVKEWGSADYVYDSVMAGSFFYNDRALELGKNQEVYDLATKRLVQLIGDKKTSLVSKQIEFPESEPEPLFKLLLDQALDAADFLDPTMTADGKELSAREQLKKTLKDAINKSKASNN